MNNLPNAQHNIVLKVQGGTAKSTVSLCKTCRNSIVVRGNNHQQIVRCQALGKDFTFDVAECTNYFDRTSPALYEMEEIAWRVVTKKAGREIGFVRPAEFYEMEREGKLK